MPERGCADGKSSPACVSSLLFPIRRSAARCGMFNPRRRCLVNKWRFEIAACAIAGAALIGMTGCSTVGSAAADLGLAQEPAAWPVIIFGGEGRRRGSWRGRWLSGVADYAIRGAEDYSGCGTARLRPRPEPGCETAVLDHSEPAAVARTRRLVVGALHAGAAPGNERQRSDPQSNGT